MRSERYVIRTDPIRCCLSHFRTNVEQYNVIYTEPSAFSCKDHPRARASKETMNLPSRVQAGLECNSSTCRLWGRISGTSSKVLSMAISCRPKAKAPLVSGLANVRQHCRKR